MAGSSAQSANLNGKVTLVTGSSQRIGAMIVRTLHAAGANVVVHYRNSVKEAANLCIELNAQRANSAISLQADLLEIDTIPALVDKAVQQWGRLDVLVNNASTFYPTPLGSITEQDWDNLLGSNLKAPLFLSQAATPHLALQHGCIVNLIDIHADRPLKDHPVYCAAKAGLKMLTQSLAREAGPTVRVNGVAPGAILWPDQGLSDGTKNHILEQIPLRRQGTPQDIADTVRFLVTSNYVNGQIIAVDGGRTVVL